MSSLIKFITTILLIILVATIHILVSYILPLPFSKINSIFICMLLLLLFTESGRVVWITFGTLFIIELYSLSPFGIILYSGTIAMLFTYWLLHDVFTNRNWTVAFFITPISLFMFRLLYILLLLTVRIGGAHIDIRWIYLFVNFLWEMLWTTLAVGAIYPFILWTQGNFRFRHSIQIQK